MENNENKNNVNVNEQDAQVENNEKKSWFGTAMGAVKNAAGTAACFAKEHKIGTAVGIGLAVIGTGALIWWKKKGNTEEPAGVDAEGFDNK